MSDIALDPYAGVSSEEEKQNIYKRLLEEHKKNEERISMLNRTVYEPLRKDWDHYRQVQLDQDSRFIKIITMVSAGVFGVSFAFIDNLIPFQTASGKTIMGIGWLLFALTLILVSLCHILSSFIHGKYCDDILEEIQQKLAEKPYTYKKRWYYVWVLSVIEWLSFLTLVGGLGCLVYFVLINL